MTKRQHSDEASENKISAPRKRSSDAMSYPPRAMRVEQAAAYLSMSRSMFLKLIDDGVMPPPIKIRGMTTWDRYDLDSAYDDLKYSAGPNENTVHKRLREIAESRSKLAK